MPQAALSSPTPQLVTADDSEPDPPGSLFLLKGYFSFHRCDMHALYEGLLQSQRRDSVGCVSVDRKLLTNWQREIKLTALFYN